MLTEEVKKQLINQVKKNQNRVVRIPVNNASRRPVDSAGAKKAAFRYLKVKPTPTVAKLAVTRRWNGRRGFTLIPGDGREYISAEPAGDKYRIHRLDGTDKVVTGNTQIAFTFSV